MESIIGELSIGERDVFVDLGSGVGNLVLQVAGASRVKRAVGIEVASIPALAAHVSCLSLLKHVGL
jgi:H3 lysine-79-specific histone-lysine N-methyltransferase